MLAHQSRTKQPAQQQLLPFGSPGVHYIGAQTIARSSKLHQNLQLTTSSSRASNGSTFQSYYDQTYQPQQQQQQHQFQQYQQQQQSGYTLSSPERNSILMMQKHYHHQQESLMSLIERQALLNRPLCRCRVMYLGSSVPHITKNGLHGIQEPLKQLYPEEQFTPGKLLAGANNSSQQQQQPNGTIDISHLSSSLGIDSWLSVWSNGLLLENVDEFGREIKRFFSIESLHYCAAVRFFDTTTLSQTNPFEQQQYQTVLRATTANGDPSTAAGQQKPFATTANSALQNELPTSTTATTPTTLNDLNNNSISRGAKRETIATETRGTTSELLSLEPAEGLARQQRQRKSVVRFLPLDAPLFQCPGMLDANHPPVFAAILRRTTGIKVLECHAFICRRDAAANALVRCCTQAYADLLSAKRLSIELAQQQQQHEAALGPNYSALAADYYRGGNSSNNYYCAPTTNSATNAPGSRTLARPSGRHRRRSSASNGGSLHRLRSSSQPAQRGDCAVIAAQLNINATSVAAAARSSAINNAAIDSNNNNASVGSNSRNNHSSSTATATIASTTNTSNEDNSLEASSEDNYAIISRHHYKPPAAAQQASSAAGAGIEAPSYPATTGAAAAQPPPPPPPSASVNSRAAHSSGGSSSSRRKAGRKKAGSSKSLFKDFMPQVSETSQVNSNVCCLNGRLSRDMSEKLSQSLDLLQLADINCGPNGGNSYCGLIDEAASASVQYSVVKSKRHSRSMQNLNPPLFATVACKGAECSGSQTGIASCYSSSSSSHRQSATKQQLRSSSKGSTRSRNGANCNDNNNNNRHSSEKSRKASSYQDMFEPIRKGGSLSSELTVHSSSGSHHELHKQQQEQRKNNCAGHNNLSSSNFYAATCDYGGCDGDCQAASSSRRASVTTTATTTSSQQQQQCRISLIRPSNEQASAIMAADQIVQLPMNDTKMATMVSSSHESRKASASKLKQHGTSTSSASSKGSRRRREALSALQYQDPVPGLAQPALPTKIYYQQQQQQAYKVLYPPPQAGPMYMGPAGCFLPVPAPYQPIYAAGPIYEPAAYLQASLARHHPHQLPPFAAVQHQPHFGTGIPYSSHPLATATLGPQKTAKIGSPAAKNPKSSLARFRCLSPPVNFLTPKQQPRAAVAASTRRAGSNKPGDLALPAGSNQSLQEDISTAAAATEVPTDTTTLNGTQEGPLSMAAKEAAGATTTATNKVTSATSASTSSLPEERIVSGTPGFISSSQATLRRKKMGWIKRLSLTMTAGLSGDESDCGSGAGQASLSVDPSGAGGNIEQQQDARSKQRKKRSGLFSGSLTLGRSRQQHAKLVTS